MLHPGTLLAVTLVVLLAFLAFCGLGALAYARLSNTVQAYETLDVTLVQEAIDHEAFTLRRAKLLDLLTELREVAFASIVFQTALTLAEEATSLEEILTAEEMTETVAREFSAALWARRSSRARSANVDAVADLWRARLREATGHEPPPTNEDSSLRDVFFGRE